MSSGTKKPKGTIPNDISSEYYQISPEILASFPKYRPPVDLFQFKESITQLYPYSRKGFRLTNEQVDEVQKLCAEGTLFVSRADHPIYSEHIIHQADLVLLDTNIKATEAADIITRALHMRLEEFIYQPVQALFEPLHKDLMVFLEFIRKDKYSIKLFMGLLYTEYTLIHHSLNSFFTGTWLLLNSLDKPEDFMSKSFERSILGLLLHDIGMSKIPSFIREKSTPLKGEEREKILQHPFLGMKMIQKLPFSFNEVTQAVMEHHERINGSGYPNKLKDKEISKIGKICAIADSFSERISNRVYAEAVPAKEAAQSLVNAKDLFSSQLSAMLLSAYVTESLPNILCKKK